MGKKQKQASPINDDKVLRYFNGKIAARLGLQESIILQQIDYWLKSSEKNETNYYDGYYWTYNTIDGWAEQFPFWSKKTTERTLLKLRESGYLKTNSYNRRKADKTLWYRIDYELLDKAINDDFRSHDNLTSGLENESNFKEPERQNDANHFPNLTSAERQNDVKDNDNLTSALPIDSYSYSIDTNRDCENQNKYSHLEEKEPNETDVIILLEERQHELLISWYLAINERSFKKLNNRLINRRSLVYNKVFIKEKDMPEILDTCIYLFDFIKVKQFREEAEQYLDSLNDIKNADLLQFLTVLKREQMMINDTNRKGDD